MDAVRLTGLRVEARHGVLEQEKSQDQWFRIDLTLWADVTAAAESDDLNLALNYAQLHDLVTGECLKTRFDLIEALAQHLCRRILEQFPAREVEVVLTKENPPIPGFEGEASVTLRRSRAWLEA